MGSDDKIIDPVSDFLICNQIRRKVRKVEPTTEIGPFKNHYNFTKMFMILGHKKVQSSKDIGTSLSEVSLTVCLLLGNAFSLINKSCMHFYSEFKKRDSKSTVNIFCI